MFVFMINPVVDGLLFFLLLLWGFGSDSDVLVFVMDL